MPEIFFQQFEIIPPDNDKILIEKILADRDFFLKCFLNRDELMKLFECGYFEIEMGHFSFDKANKKLREADTPKKWKWAK